MCLCYWNYFFQLETNMSNIEKKAFPTQNLFLRHIDKEIYLARIIQKDTVSSWVILLVVQHSALFRNSISGEIKICVHKHFVCTPNFKNVQDFENPNQKLLASRVHFNQATDLPVKFCLNEKHSMMACLTLEAIFNMQLRHTEGNT